MKRYLRPSIAVATACAAVGMMLHSGTRTHAIADAVVRVPIPPLVLIADSLRTVTTELDDRIAQLQREELALRSRISLPVLSASLEDGLRPAAPHNDVELPIVRNDAFLLENRIEQQERFVHAIGRAIEARRELLGALPLLTPCQGSNTSNFGMRVHPISGEEKMHTGVDIAAPHGRPIRAAGDGVVCFSGTKNGYGNMIEIDHGFGYRTLYGHASRLNVKLGDTVHRGDVVAFVGATGAATGPHLHYEVIVDDTKVNPMPFLVESPVMDAQPAAPEKLAAGSAVKTATAKAATTKAATAKAASGKAAPGKTVAAKANGRGSKTSVAGKKGAARKAVAGRTGIAAAKKGSARKTAAKSVAAKRRRA